MNVIQVAEHRILKLTNVLSHKLSLDEMDNISVVVTQMENYVKAIGAMPVGPLIQHTVPYVNSEGALDVEITLMRQTDKFLTHVDPRYKMESVLRVKNCLFAHYVGPDAKLKLAYDKLHIYAFEHEFDLKGDNYTIFVNSLDDQMVTDVFMEMC